MRGLIQFATLIKTGMVVEDLGRAVAALTNEETVKLLRDEFGKYSKFERESEQILLWMALRAWTRFGDLEASKNAFKALVSKPLPTKWWMVELFTKKREISELRKIINEFHVLSTGDLNIHFLPYLEPKDLLSEAATSYFTLRNALPSKILGKKEFEDVEKILLGMDSKLYLSTLDKSKEV